MEIRQPQNLKPLAPFIESDAQIDKKTLIERCAGKVTLSLLLLIKLTVFHHAEKDSKGNVILA